MSKCSDCNGTGVCTVCKGKGFYWSPIAKKCRYCGETGKCPKCRS